MEAIVLRRTKIKRCDINFNDVINNYSYYMFCLISLCKVAFFLDYFVGFDESNYFNKNKRYDIGVSTI